MSERAYLDYRVVRAAREWLQDRVPRDRNEKQLLVVLWDAYPGDFSTKERCTCEEKDGCEECPSHAEAQASIDRMRGELSESYRDAAPAHPGARP